MESVHPCGGCLLAQQNQRSGSSFSLKNRSPRDPQSRRAKGLKAQTVDGKIEISEGFLRLGKPLSKGHAESPSSRQPSRTHTQSTLTGLQLVARAQSMRVQFSHHKLKERSQRVAGAMPAVPSSASPCRCHQCGQTRTDFRGSWHPRAHTCAFIARTPRRQPRKWFRRRLLAQRQVSPRASYALPFEGDARKTRAFRVVFMDSVGPRTAPFPVYLDILAFPGAVDVVS